MKIRTVREVVASARAKRPTVMYTPGGVLRFDSHADAMKAARDRGAVDFRQWSDDRFTYDNALDGGGGLVAQLQS